MDQFRKNLTASEITEIFRYELYEAKRPPEERVLNDADLCRILKVSKRTTASWRSDNVLAYHKIGGIILYLYADVLKMIRENRVEPVQEKLKIRL